MVKSMSSSQVTNSYIEKAIEFISKNKLYFIGIALGLLVMLPTGIYLSSNLSNQQLDQDTSQPTQIKNLGTDEPVLTTPALTPGPTPSTEPVSKQNTSNSSKPYVASVCTKKPIPYKTIYKESSGASYSLGGIDGIISTCTADSNGNIIPGYTIQPIDKTVYSGSSSSYNSSACSSYTTAYNTAVQLENSRYSNLKSEINGAIRYMGSVGAGGSSAVGVLRTKLAQNEIQHTSTLSSLLSTYNSQKAAGDC